MSLWLPLLLALQGLLIARLVARHVAAWRVLRAVPNLTPAAPRHWEKDDYWPFVSIVIEADPHDAPDDFEDRLCGWLSQDYPHFELLVLSPPEDGTSPPGANRRDAELRTDRSAIERVVRLACESGRARRVVRSGDGHTMPGIRGTFHATSQSARGGWLLFAGDAVRGHRSAVTTAMREALCRRADLLSVLPAFRRGTWREMATFPAAATWLAGAVPLARIHDDTCERAAVVLGRFLLARPGALDEAFAGLDDASVNAHVNSQSEGSRGVDQRNDLKEGFAIGRAARAAGLRVRVARGSRIAAASLTARVDDMLIRWSDLFRSAAGSPGRLRVQYAGWIAGRIVPIAAIVVACLLRRAEGGSPLATILLTLGVSQLALEIGLDAWICRAARVPYAWLWLRTVGVSMTTRALWRSMIQSVREEIDAAAPRRPDPAESANNPSDRAAPRST